MIRYRWTIVILALFMAASSLALPASGQPGAAFQGQAAPEVPFFSQTALGDQRVAGDVAGAGVARPLPPEEEPGVRA